MGCFLEYVWILNYCKSNNRALDLEDKVRNSGPDKIVGITIPTNIIVFERSFHFSQ